MSTHRFRSSAVVLMAASLIAAPAFATKDFRSKGPAGLARDAGLAGAPHRGETQVHTPRKIAHAAQGAAKEAAPSPAGWLMMLAGFGVLGVATRRSAPHPLDVQQLA